MIVWLASFPRSGSTLLRIILNQAFGVSSFSLYDDRADIAANPALAELVGHRSHGTTWQKFLATALSAPDQLFVKTHGKPGDTAKAIYLVRDGRAALVSFYHYHKDIAKVNVSLAQVVKGDVWGGSWSANVDAWVFSGRPNTLVLRFEDLISNQAESLDALADFLQLKMLSKRTFDFSELNALAPTFFRKGSNTLNTAELEAACPELFWSLHGKTMVRLGYVRSHPAR